MFAFSWSYRRGAEILVEGSVLEHVVDSGQDRSGHGADRFLRAASSLEAEENWAL
jgi:hypothetical protein